MKRLTVLTMLFIAMLTPAFAQSGQPWKKQLNLDLGIQFPGGDLSNQAGLATGWGGATTFYYQLLTRQTFLSLGIGYYSFGVGSTNSNTTVTEIPLLLGVRYNFALTGFQPYIGAEFGAYIGSVKVGDQVVDGSVGTDFGIQPKAGFRLPISPGFDFDASVKFHVIMSETSFSFIGLNAGIAYTID